MLFHRSADRRLQNGCGEIAFRHTRQGPVRFEPLFHLLIRFFCQDNDRHLSVGACVNKVNASGMGERLFSMTSRSNPLTDAARFPDRVVVGVLNRCVDEALAFIRRSSGDVWLSTATRHQS
jgi:hypothetical protein